MTVFDMASEEFTSLLKENQELNQKYLNAVADYETTMSELQELRKQLEERPKEYVFIGNAQNKTRDFINQITKDNKEFKNQQKEFISYLENCINELKKESMNKLQNAINLGIVDITKEILSKYQEIIGGKE